MSGLPLEERNTTIQIKEGMNGSILRTQKIVWEKIPIMKKILKVLLCFIGLICAIVFILGLCISYVTNYKKVTVDTSVSPDGKYELTLQAVGEPDWPFDSASGGLVLKKGKDKISQTDFELYNDGGNISSSCWKVTWYEDYVEIILSGEEQSDEQVILYFDGTKDSRQLTDTEEDSISGDELDESRVLAEQSFGVNLNVWGDVRFVSYMPSYDDTPLEDVSFVLVKDNQMVYHFPACFENNSTENEGIGMFDSVEAVGFQDINGDGARDVIVIINYVTGAGTQGMLPRKTVRVFRAYDYGFIILEDLMNDIMENIEESELSISAIYDYLELTGTDEIYDGYCIYIGNTLQRTDMILKYHTVRMEIPELS